jgi:hypothetical protein
MLLEQIRITIYSGVDLFINTIIGASNLVKSRASIMQYGEKILKSVYLRKRREIKHWLVHDLDLFGL